VKQGTGMQTMQHLARQLSGTVRYEQLSKGTELRLNFPAKPVHCRSRRQNESRSTPSRIRHGKHLGAQTKGRAIGSHLSG
jgi:hypothetical protein